MQRPGDRPPRFYRERPILALLSSIAIVYSWPVAIIFGFLYPSLDWPELYSRVRAMPMMNEIGDLLAPPFSCADYTSLNSFVSMTECEHLKTFVTLYMMGVAATIVLQIAVYIALATQVRRLARSMHEDPIRTAWNRISADYAPIYWIVLFAVAFVFYYWGLAHKLSIKFSRGEFNVAESLFRYTILNTFFMTFLMLSSLSVINIAAYRISRRWLGLF